MGFLAARYVGRRGLLMSAAFVAGTAAGFAGGIAGVAPAAPETAILATVVATGLLLAAPDLAAPALAASAIGLRRPRRAAWIRALGAVVVTAGLALPLLG